MENEETIMERRKARKMCNRHRRLSAEETATTATPRDGRRRKEVESLKEGFKVEQGKMIN